jgi:hypothetical protein
MHLGLLGRTCVFVRVHSRLHPVERFWGSPIPRKIRGQEADDPQTRKVNSADRGFSTTDLNGHRGTQTIPEGAAEAIRLAAPGPRFHGHLLRQ